MHRELPQRGVIFGEENLNKDAKKRFDELRLNE